jgi:polyisoprenoid-binding protein YceI
MLNKHSTILLLLIVFHLTAHAQQTKQLDLKKSKILWNTGKTMGGHYGYFLFSSGNLVYSFGGEPLSGSFSMDMKSMRSTDKALDAAGNQRVDTRLLTEDFFAVDRYPISTMNVKKITRVGNSTSYKVSGDLTIKGVTNPIEFMATIQTTDSITTVTGNLDIHRLKWGIHPDPNAKPLDFLSAMAEKVVTDQIYVELNLTFSKQ